MLRKSCNHKWQRVAEKSAYRYCNVNKRMSLHICSVTSIRKNEKSKVVGRTSAMNTKAGKGSFLEIMKTNLGSRSMPNPDWYEEQRMNVNTEMSHNSDQEISTFRRTVNIFAEVVKSYVYTFDDIFPGICKRLFGKEFDVDESGNLVEKTSFVKPLKSGDSSTADGYDTSLDGMEDRYTKNLHLMKESGNDILDKVKKETGVTSKAELQDWLNDLIKLGIKCLAQFMKGYRSGRDYEFEKMLTSYFQEEEKLLSQPQGGRAEEGKKNTF